MALVLADRVLETTTTTGSGTITLAGAEPGYQAFSVIGNANQTYYTITADTDWEVGIGTYTASGTTLSRDTVLASSNSGNRITLPAGSKKVFVTYPAEKSVNLDVSGNISLSSAVISGVGYPSAASDAATKQYVDSLAEYGITYHSPVKYEVPSTTGNLNATYNNGTAGVSATLTNAGTLAAFVPDGVTATISDRVLIYNQSNGFENGVYTVKTVGNGSTAWVLMRATDADTYALKSPNSLGGGDAFYVTSGNTGAGETYLCNNSGTIVFGSTAISFVQISAAQVYSAGTGISLTNTVISLVSPVAVATGGTGTTATPTNGQLLIGNGSGYTLSTLTAGSGVSITNSAGSITLTATGSGGTVVEVKATSPLASSGGTSPTISIANSTGTGSVVLDQGATISSATITAALSASITTITGTSANITTVSGTTARFSSAAITQLSGTSAGITTVTGTTTTFSSGTITQFGATSATIASVSGTNATYSNGNFTSAIVSTISGTTATYTSGTITTLKSTSATVDNLNSTSANIATLTGTTFGTTATTQLRGASADITTLTGSSMNVTTATHASANITTLSGTTLTYSSATITNLNATSITLANLSITSANITTLTGTNVTYTSGTVTNLNSTSANIATLTGTTFGTTATTQLRGASAQITTATVTSANITTLTGTTLGTFTSGTVTNLNSTSANITTLSGTTVTYTSGTITGLTSTGLRATSANVTTLTGTNLTYTSGTVTTLTSSNVITTSAYGAMSAIRGSYFGYSSGYGAIVIGSTAANQTTCIAVDPVGNASGAFSGGGGEVMFRNAVNFISPNSANNGYHNYGNLTDGKATWTQLSSTSATITTLSGTTLGYSGTSTLNKVNIGGVTTASGAGLNVSSVSSGASPITAKTTDYATVCAVLPWASGTTYISSGVYFNGSAWVHASSDSTNCLLAITGNGNTTWYASNNSSGSFNVASAVPLWSAAGVLVAQISSASATITTITSTSANITTLTGTTLSDGAGNVRNIPSAGADKTSVYTLAITDIGEYVGIGTGGGIDVPNGVFSTGNAISIFNNTTGNRTISLTITTAYIAGTDADKNSVTLATRGLATILFLSNSVCVISGNVT